MSNEIKCDYCEGSGFVRAYSGDCDHKDCHMCKGNGTIETDCHDYEDYCNMLDGAFDAAIDAKIDEARERKWDENDR